MAKYEITFETTDVTRVVRAVTDAKLSVSPTAFGRMAARRIDDEVFSFEVELERLDVVTSVARRLRELHIYAHFKMWGDASQEELDAFEVFLDEEVYVLIPEGRRSRE